MGAVFGILGNATQGDVEAMARRLTHRGRNTASAPIADGGWLGVVTDEPDLRLRITEDSGIACDVPFCSEENPLDYLGRAVENVPCQLAHLVAEFALARIDARQGVVTLARDFLGCAPLYFVRASNKVAFASEYKALLALPGVSVVPDRDMVQYLQHAKRLPLGRTLHRDIHAVLPGSMVTMNSRGEVVAEQRVAPLQVHPCVYSAEEACELLRTEYERAVRMRSCDCDPLALALSGGIDSISLAFVLRRLWPERRILTFTAGSNDRDHDVVTARRVAAAIGAEHHQIITTASKLEQRMPELVWHLEDPFSRSESLQLYEIAQEADSQGVRVLFSGQGADGLFGGMPKYKLLALMCRYPSARRALQEFYTYTQLGLRPQHLLARLGVAVKFRGSVPDVPRVRGARRPEPISFPELGDQFINRFTSAGFQLGICQDIQKYERTFGAFGIQYRSPFYDMQLVQAAYAIDDALKIRGGQEKWVFRRAVENWVPAEFVDVPKVPQRMEANSELADALDALADEVLSREAITSRGLFDWESVAALLRKNRSRPYSYEGAMRLWTAIATELWAGLFVDCLGTPPHARTREAC